MSVEQSTCEQPVAPVIPQFNYIKEDPIVIESKKILYCGMSLFNISKDLSDIDPTLSQICVTMSKSLIAKLSKIERPEAIIHSPNAPHNTNIGKEIEDIIKEIRAAEV